jgi:hypothetical protein
MGAMAVAEVSGSATPRKRMGLSPRRWSGVIMYVPYMLVVQMLFAAFSFPPEKAYAKPPTTPPPIAKAAFKGR